MRRGHAAKIFPVICLLVRYHAGRLMLGASPPMSAAKTFIQAGRPGLMEAMRRYDPSRGIKFETFASRRIKGANSLMNCAICH